MMKLLYMVASVLSVYWQVQVLHAASAASNKREEKASIGGQIPGVALGIEGLSKEDTELTWYRGTFSSPITAKESICRVIQRGREFMVYDPDTDQDGCLLSKIDVVRYFIEQIGVDINQKYVDGWCLLHFVACCGEKDVADYLLGQGADSTHLNDKGQAPWLIAGLRGNTKLAGRLFDAYNQAMKEKEDEWLDGLIDVVGRYHLDIA